MHEQPNPNADLIMDVHLAEYAQAREDYLERFRSRQQTIVLGLGAFSVGLPLLVSQAQSLTLETLVILLYAFVVIFSGLAMQISSLTYDLALVSQYINKHLAPEIDRVLRARPEQAIMQFERYSQFHFRKPVGLFMSLTSSIGILLLVLFPSTVALIGAQYCRQLLALQPTAVAIPAQALSLWLALISLLAWVSYLVSIADALGTLIYWLISGKEPIKKKVKEK